MLRGGVSCKDWGRHRHGCKGLVIRVLVHVEKNGDAGGQREGGQWSSTVQATQWLVGEDNDDSGLSKEKQFDGGSSLRGCSVSWRKTSGRRGIGARPGPLVCLRQISGTGDGCCRAAVAHFWIWAVRRGEGV